MITAKNISKTLSGRQVINDISVNIDTREITILFGPSGSGKSTLCRVLSLLDTPDQGEICMLGQQFSFPGKVKNAAAVYPQIGFVFQQLFLWPHLTIEENILLATKNMHDYTHGQYLMLLEELEIADIMKRYPNEISVGQRQRAAIARTLILKPQYIFLDEITSALDIVQTKKIGDVLKRLKHQGVGTLLITHNIDYFKSIGDKFLFLDNGQIVERGSSKMLLDPQTFELKTFLY